MEKPIYINPMNSFKIKEEINLESVDSTQIYARKLIEERSPKDLVLITAEQQTSGIGRHGRTWHSPNSGNIYMTLIIPGNYKTFQDVMSILPLLTSVSISQTLEEVGIENKIKWVNDILSNDNKKLSGILVETILEGEDFYILIGIGINVNMGADELNKIDQPTTSMKLCKDLKEFNKEIVMKKLINYLLQNLKSVLEGEKKSIIDYVNSKLAFKSTQVKIVDSNGNEEIGEIKEVNENGFLVLENENTSKTIYDGRLFPL